MLEVSSLKVLPEKHAETLLKKYGVATVNGISYGQSAKNYVRLSLTQDEDELNEVIRRLINR